MRYAAEVDGVTWTAEVVRSAPDDDEARPEARGNPATEGQADRDPETPPAPVETSGMMPDGTPTGSGQSSSMSTAGQREETRVWLRSSDGRQQSIPIGYVDADDAPDIDEQTIATWVREYFPGGTADSGDPA